MNNPTTQQQLRPRVRAMATIALLMLTLTTVQTAHAQPSQEPLLSRESHVRPNLLFMLDTSDSMSSEVIPAAHWLAANSNGICNSDKVHLLTQSPSNNTLMYNPARRYEPGFDNSGTRVNNAPVPPVWTPLTVYMAKPGEDIVSLTSMSQLCDPGRYDRVDVAAGFLFNGIPTSGLPAYSGRTDCNGGMSACTLEQEKQNITHWRTYHMTRMAAARTGVGSALSNQKDTFRLGYSTIFVESPFRTSFGHQLYGVKDWGLVKTSFYTWLNGLTPADDTPLRTALDVAGQYFSRTDNLGPWSANPWISDSAENNGRLSCRRSHTVLITDGQWTSRKAQTPAARADVDGSIGPEIVHANGVTKYQYKPRDPDARSLGKADNRSIGAIADTLADVAMYYWARDLQPDMLNDVTAGSPQDKPFWQNMTTHTGAFGVTGKLSENQVRDARRGLADWHTAQPAAQSDETVDDLIHAAHNGGGSFFNLTTVDSFTRELGEVVANIAGGSYSQAGVSASATSLAAGSKKFVPYFRNGEWWGNLKMVELASNGGQTGTVWEVVSTEDDKPTGPAKIAAHDARPIFTWTPSTKGMEFRHANLQANGLISSSSAAPPNMLSSTVNADMVNYLRGDRSLEGDLKPYRPRKAILGDIVNSSPVFVKDMLPRIYESLPEGTAGKSQYAAYVATKQARTEGLVLAGANDGMVHGFREGTGAATGGTETFAFIPRSVFPNLHLLADPSYQHKYFVDGPLSESDAYIAAPDRIGAGFTTRWANLVLGSTGAGARSVFALDATWPLEMGARSILWETTHLTANMANLGHVMSQVETGITASGNWVAIVGNGPYGSSGKASLFILDLATGALLKEIATNDELANGLGGVRIVRDPNSRIIGAYAGDLQGNVWRFNLASMNSAGWPSRGDRLYTAADTAGSRQPITAAPAVFRRPDQGHMVVAVTGKLYDTTDPSSTQLQSAYGLWDQGSFNGEHPFSTIAGLSQLVGFNAPVLDNGRFYNQTPSRPIDWRTDRGWFLRYTLLPGQRSVYPAEPLMGQLVRIDTVVPNPGGATCERRTSAAFNYLVDPMTGMCQPQSTFDTNGDGLINDSDSLACIYSSDADGSDVVLASDAMAGDGPGSFASIQGAGGYVRARLQIGRTICLGTDSCPRRPTITRSWRQIYMRERR
jgi:type IV pilus assembly protein PilY1